MRLLKPIGITLILISTISCTEVKHHINIDNCLDRGGRWNNETNKCEFQRNESHQTNKHLLNTNTIQTRFKPPQGFIRSEEVRNSFQSYLRNLKLKPIGTLVSIYNGAVKSNDNIYCAVVDLDIGEKDLHQCADAIIRLRAEYLWETEQYERIHFKFTNGFEVQYKEWMKGKRVIIEGNKTYWNNQYAPSNSYTDFWNYLELIFMYAGTSSLQKELKNISVEDASIGDVLIQGGFPGHGVIIVDKAVNHETNQSLYILAQSYMPAQDIQILINPNNEGISPWFDINSAIIKTPEWTFKSNDLMRFQN
jgi:hypothetical protein